jgi:uncharacterized protein (TIGR02145 family)
MKYKYVIIFAATIICSGVTGLKAQTVKDIDGNIYKTVTIGKQVWMAENLKTTKYNDGKVIPTGNDAWYRTDAICFYDNSFINKRDYGALYNWDAVLSGKLCPIGWHVSTDAEWTTLTTFLGGESVAGGKLKEIGTTHWLSPNVGATNESGFTVLPSGSLNRGEFNNMMYYGYFWTATSASDLTAWFRSISKYDGQVVRATYTKSVGFAVRCLKDK